MGVQEKLMRNFHDESLFLTLEFPSGVTQICIISRGKSFFTPENLGVKWQIENLQGGFLKKYILKSPLPLPFWIFSGNISISMTKRIESTQRNAQFLAPGY